MRSIQSYFTRITNVNSISSYSSNETCVVMDDNGDMTTKEVGLESCKPFKVPCKTPFEPFIEKFVADLEIRCSGDVKIRRNINRIRTQVKKAANAHNSNNVQKTSTRPLVEPATSKPGTLGSRQALNAPTQRSRKNKTQFNQNPLNPLESRLNNLSPPADLIDTKNFVEDSFLVFLPEFCQRAGIATIPSDPQDVCKKFNLLLPMLDPELLKDATDQFNLNGD